MSPSTIASTHAAPIERLPTLGLRIATMYRVVPCIVAIILYNDYVKRAIVIESKPKVFRKGVIAKTRAAKNKQSKNYIKKSRGQGSRGARKSNG